MANKLTIKQEKFCNKYLECGNASEAYRFVYGCKNWSDKSVWEKASTLLNSVKVQSRVKELQKELQDRSDINKDEAVKELTNIVRGRLTEVFAIKGDTIKIKNLHELPDDIIACIESIKETNNGIEIKFYNKIQAIASLRAMMGWDAPQKVAQTDSQGNDVCQPLTPERRREILKETGVCK